MLHDSVGQPYAMTVSLWGGYEIGPCYVALAGFELKATPLLQPPYLTGHDCS